MKFYQYLCLALILGLVTVGCGNSAPAPAATTATESTIDHVTEGESETESPANSQEEETSSPNQTLSCPLEDGIYTASFKSDSSMFHLNESCHGRGQLTVEKGKMTIHLTMVSKKIVNLYPGSKDQAMQDTEGWLMPTNDQVTYSDGMTEEVYGFDLPVPVLGEEFPCALIGTHDNWYDHMVVVSDVEKAE